MKKLLFYIILFLVSQLTVAEQVHEIDVNNCPNNLTVYHGDTIRWFNSSSQTHSVKSALFGLQYIASKKNYEYHFPASLHSVKASYFCINDTTIDDSTESILTVERSPIAIFPKTALLPDKNYFSSRLIPAEWIKYFDIQLFISDDNPLHEDDKIEQLSILVDGQLVIDSIDDLNRLTESPNGDASVTVAGIFANGSGSTVRNSDKGYNLYTFHLLKRNFSVGEKHLVQVSLTIKTDKGEATYHDEADFLLISGFDTGEF